MLFHVSEDGRIAHFQPRPSEYTTEPVVWAIEESRLCNYLVPRDCPRVTYYAGPQTTKSDIEKFLTATSVVVAVESAWLERIRSCRLYVYSMPATTFESLDECAGYFVSRVPVVPTRVHVVDDVIAELLRRGVELRFVPDLTQLGHVVVQSTLLFSLIRMRHAAKSKDRACRLAGLANPRERGFLARWRRHFQPRNIDEER